MTTKKMSSDKAAQDTKDKKPQSKVATEASALQDDQATVQDTKTIQEPMRSTEAAQSTTETEHSVLEKSVSDKKSSEKAAIPMDNVKAASAKNAHSENLSNTPVESTEVYIKPEKVTAPRDLWALEAVLYDGGPDNGSVVLGTWDERRVLAMRWNGNRAMPKGNPLSSTHPTWFVVPEAFTLAVLLGTAYQVWQHQSDNLHSLNNVYAAFEQFYGARFTSVNRLSKKPLIKHVLKAATRFIKSRK